MYPLLCIYTASIHTATMHTEHRNAYMHTQSPSIHRNACVSYPFTHVYELFACICVTSHNACTGSCSVHSVTGPQAAAPRPQLICTERQHMGHTCSHAHIGTCAIMPGGVTYVCPALHVERSMRTSASNIDAVTQDPPTVMHSHGC